MSFHRFSIFLAVFKDLVSELERSMPHDFVEPLVLEFSSSTDGIQIGCLLAPYAVHADYVTVDKVPDFVRPGHALSFHLSLSDGYPRRSPAELKVATESLVHHTLVKATLIIGETTHPLNGLVVCSDDDTIVRATVSIPEDAPEASCVEITAVLVTGNPVTRGCILPARITVVSGMFAPLQLTVGAKGWTFPTITISLNATLYVPLYDSPDILTFSADGSPQPPLSVASLGMSSLTRVAAFVEATGTLLFADSNGASSKLVSVNEATKAATWLVSLRGGCYGMAVLSAHGVIVVGDNAGGMLHSRRLSDGSRISSTAARSPFFVTADSASATVYVNTNFEVSIFKWDGAELVAKGRLDAAGSTGKHRPLAVVPPTPGKHTPCLIVGTYGTPALRVLSLPDLRVIHEHTLWGIKVMGMATDSAGTVLAVCDYVSKAVQVLPWPLPGMPPLQ
jgi:hypothetical protein